MSGSSVLFDVPGPRARARHAVFGAVVVVLIAAIVGFVLWRFIVTGQFSASKWQIFGYGAIWSQILAAVGRTLSAFAAAAILSIVLGFALAIGRLSDHAVIRVPVMLFTELFRAIPVLILMMISYYGLPTLGIRITPFVAVVAALTLYNGSVFAEIFRAGVESLPKGQSEAAKAIGLRKGQMLFSVLLPQGLRAMLPITVAQLVVVLKDTALGFIVTYQELLYLAKAYGSNFQYGSPIIQSTIVMGSIYILLCLALAGVAKLVELRLTRGGRGGRRRTRVVPADTLAVQKIRAEQSSNSAGGAGV